MHTLKAIAARSWKTSLLLPALLVVGCGVPIGNNPGTPGSGSNGGDSSDGRVTVENKVYTEAEVRSALDCYKNSSNAAAKTASAGFQTAFDASLSLKNQGLNVQYEGSLRALIQSMLLFDRGNNTDCIN